MAETDEPLADLYARARSSIVRNATPIVGRGDAEDILHDAFVAYLHRRAEILQPEAWLHRVARNRALNTARHPHRSLEHDVAEDPRDESIDVHDLVAQSMERLRVRAQTALRLRYFQEADYESIASELATTVAQAHVVVHRAVKQLGREIVRQVASRYDAPACIEKLEHLAGLTEGAHNASPCERCAPAWSELSRLQRLSALIPLGLLRSRRMIGRASHSAATVAASVVLLITIGAAPPAPRVPSMPPSVPARSQRLGNVTKVQGIAKTTGARASATTARAPMRIPVQNAKNAGPVGLTDSGAAAQIDVGRGGPAWAGAALCGARTNCDAAR